MQGEEDMQRMVPAAHQASDYSEQDLCVEAGPVLSIYGSGAKLQR
jgi:hypothetical protein